MTFAIMLGFIQVILGLILQAKNKIRHSGFIYGLQPISYVFMIIGMLICAAHADILGLGGAFYRTHPNRTIFNIVPSPFRTDLFFWRPSYDVSF